MNDKSYQRDRQTDRRTDRGTDKLKPISLRFTGDNNIELVNRSPNLSFYAYMPIYKTPLPPSCVRNFMDDPLNMLFKMNGKRGFVPELIYSVGGGGDFILPCKNKGDLFRRGGGVYLLRGDLIRFPL